MSLRTSFFLSGQQLALATLLTLCGACTQVAMLPGTHIPSTKENRAVIDRIEEYRVAMEQRDPARVLSMASPNYYEDSGTPSGADDYGYAGLRHVLNSRLPAVRTMRYAIQYRNLALAGVRATVDIRYDVSYQLATEMGERWERKQSDKRLELINDNGRWLFLSGL